VFAASFVFLASSATAVVPTVAALVIQHAVLVGARATRGSQALAPRAVGHTHEGHGAGAAVGAWDAAALALLMMSCGATMCAVSRG